MTKSTITVKNQMTVPREIRIKLAVVPATSCNGRSSGTACW
jgi:hypothetical protein